MVAVGESRRRRTSAFVAAVRSGRPVRVGLATAIAVGVSLPVATGAVTFGPSAGAAGTTYVVDSVADTGLAGDGSLCGGGASPCTLRAAIERAEAQPGHDRIEFAIPAAGPHRIEPSSAFPLLTDQAGVTIDGYTQPAASVNTLDHGSNADIRIELRGPGPASDVVGLDLRSSGNVIRGLAIFDFDKQIRIFGPDFPGDSLVDDVSHNEIIGNFIGTDAGGTHSEAALVTGSDGVQLQHGTTSNRIGKPGNEHRNVISGLADRGVGLYNPGTNFNLIQNNLVGLAPGADGITPLGSQNHGVDINLGASYNTVGGWNPGEGNVLSANGESGVEVSHNPTTGVTESNLVVGNLIGTSADGTRALASTANDGYGIYFEGAELCLTTCPADIARNVAAANVVVGSRTNIALSKGATENLVSGNWIGVLADGSKPESSAVVTQQGVSLEAGAFGNRIENNTIGHAERGIHAMPLDSQCPKLTEPNGPQCRAGEFPVFHNTFSQNSIRDVHLLGIELREKKSSGYIDGPGADPKVNDGIAEPVIVASGADQATTDRLVVMTCPGCVVEVFAEVPAAGICCWLDRGIGHRYLFSATADGAGRVDLTMRSSAGDALLLEPNTEISATATDGSGNTSEVSRRVTVALGSVPLPSPPTTSTSTTTSTTIPIPSSTTVPVPTTPVTVGPVVGGAAADGPALRCRMSADC